MKPGEGRHPRRHGPGSRCSPTPPQAGRAGLSPMPSRWSTPSSTGTGASIPWRDLPEVYGPWLSRVDLARPHGRRGHLGHGAGNTDRRSGCRNRDRLVGLGGLHDRPRPSAREEHHPAHRGLDRTTRNPREEPADHGLGRSRSGLSTKTHQLVDGAGREGVLIAGDRHPSARRWHQGRPPQPADQQGHRRRRGSAGGRPVGLDSEAYTGRNVIERQDAHLKQWPGLASRYDEYAIVYWAAVVLNAVLAWSTALSDTPEWRVRTDRRSRSSAREARRGSAPAGMSVRTWTERIPRNARREAA